MDQRPVTNPNLNQHWGQHRLLSPACAGAPPNSSAEESRGRIFRIATAGGIEGRMPGRRLKKESCFRVAVGEI